MLIIFDLDDTLYDRTGQVPDAYTDEHLRRIVPFPGVREFLSSHPAKKVLVTKETVPGVQEQKIKALGIRQYFDQIMVCRSAEQKEEFFQQLLAQYPAEEIWAVGDRVDLEIQFGKKYGFKTVWLRHGNHSHKQPRGYWQVPDYEISEFSELKEIVERERVEGETPP